MKNKDDDMDDLLNKLFELKPATVQESLDDLFDQRLVSLKISKTTALNIMGMESRTLKGILSGEQKILDYTQLIKLANFLGIQLEEVATMYLEKLQKEQQSGFGIKNTNEMIDFVNENFNLAELRKMGLIKSLTDYNDIINSICKYFGLKEIFDYEEPEMNIAFSAGKRAKKNISVKNWMFLAEQTCIELRNTNEFNREKLIEYFPQIRWFSMDVEKGLVSVISHLFQIGITVVLIPSFPSLHIRGATFCVNDKPCIALTDYVGFYPTLWFALIHELFHVLFDWDEIVISDYHISADDDYFDKSSQNEKEANEFARQYLFSKEKTMEISSNINNSEMVRSYALANHVHPSFAYVYYAYDAPKTNRTAWGRAKKLNPDSKSLKDKLQLSFNGKLSFNEHIKILRNNIYN